MTSHDDCVSDMNSFLPTDADVERLIAGGRPDDPRYLALMPLIEEMKRLNLNRAVDEPGVIASAAGVAREAIKAPTAPRRFIPRLVAASAAAFSLVGIATAAVASNGAAPGELMYFVDQALESVGLGDGGIDERIIEVASLLGDGEADRAIAHLDASVEVTEVASVGAVSERVELHLNLAENMTHGNSAETQEHVASLRQFIEENKGKGVGLDGQDFGHGVADSNPGHAGSEGDPADQPSGGQGTGQGQGQGQGNGDGQGNGNGQGNANGQSQGNGQGQGQANGQGQGNGNGPGNGKPGQWEWPGQREWSGSGEG